jgi:hypothetical protein
VDENKFVHCEWCGEQLYHLVRCPKCGSELRVKAPEIAKKVGVNIKKAFEYAPFFRDRNDPDFFIITLSEAIEYLIGETIPIDETINPLITDDVKDWYKRAWLYLNHLPED